MKKTYIISLLLFTLTSCNIQTTFGPYHHEAVINKPLKQVQYRQDSYFHIESNLYKSNNETFDQIIINNDLNIIVYDFDIYNDKFYIATDNGLNVYNNNLIYEKTLTKDKASSFLIHDDTLYYHRLNAFETLFYKYNLKTDERELIKESIKNDIYTDCSRPIYINEQGILFFLDEVGIANITKGATRQTTLGFAYDNKVGTITTKNGTLTLSYENQTYELPVFINTNYYNCFSIVDKKMTFAVYEFLKNEDCNYFKCVCRYGQAKLIQFNFETLKFEMNKAIKNNSYILDLDDKNVIYYNDGNIYKNNEILKTINKIEPKGQYIQSNSNASLNGATKVTDVFMTYYNNKLILKEIDYSDSIKDEY